MAYETDTFGLAHTFKTSFGVTINLNAGGDYGWCIDKEETTQALCRRSRTKHREISTRFTSIRPMTARQMISEIHTSRCAFSAENVVLQGWRSGDGNTGHNGQSCDGL